MAQTTGQISFKDVKLETSPDNSVWTDISGFAGSVKVDGGERITGKQFTFDGETAIRGVGKLDTMTITASIVYTEGASDPVEVIRALYEAGSDFYLRYSPKGGDNAEFLYTTDAGTIKNPLYPSGEAGSGDPIMVDIVLEISKITKSAVA